MSLIVKPISAQLEKDLDGLGKMVDLPGFRTLMWFAGSEKKNIKVKSVKMVE